MIDLHSHVLPGIDDGSPSLDVTIDMLDVYARHGFRTVAATPHLMGHLDSAYRAAVEAAFREVEPLARERGITLLRGFEIRLAPSSPEQVLRGEPVTYEDTKAALVDLAFAGWPLYTESALFGIQAAGCRVVLAHPERYPAIQEDPAMADELVSRGVILQVTIGSFSGAFGKRAKKCAEELLARGVVQLAATDAHSAGHRMAAMPAGLQRMSELLGEEQVRQLTVAAPAALLNGDPVPGPVRAVKASLRSRLTGAIRR